MAAPRSATVDPVLRGELIELLASSSQGKNPVGTDLRTETPEALSVRCVLFDVYGTLFMSASGDVGSAKTESLTVHFEGAMERAGFKILEAAAPSEAEQRYFQEIRNAHADARGRGVDYPEVDIIEIWTSVLAGLIVDRAISLSEVQSSDFETRAYLAATAYEVLSNPVQPMPGMLELISNLSKSELLLGIVSNAQFFTPLLFPAFLGKSHTLLGFRDDLCSWSYLAGRAKPSGLIFDPLLERLSRKGIAADAVLYVGNDMLNDVWAAREAGCRTALFAGDKRSLRLRTDDPRCKDLVPDLVVVSLLDLLDPLGLPVKGKKGSAR
ncbi:MAG TPA: HAD family hydrolase [Spirochaetia bacterium]|nr:HAD family hydrolase [Spirochaetia bacterium]